jgi:hypothetical protein
MVFVTEAVAEQQVRLSPFGLHRVRRTPQRPQAGHNKLPTQPAGHSTVATPQLQLQHQHRQELHLQTRQKQKSLEHSH